MTGMLLNTTDQRGGSFPSRQKIALIFFGILLSFILLEAGLRLAGAAIIFFQGCRNRISMASGGAYRILCLGESTTQNQYPVFLEKALNDSGIGVRFSVIDEGLGSTNTTVILEKVDGYIRKYRPHMVVAMMGINDFGRHMPVETEKASRTVEFLRKFKLYKFSRFLGLRISAKIDELFGKKCGGRLEVSLGGLLGCAEAEAGDMPQHSEEDIRRHIEAASEAEINGDIKSAEKHYLKVVSLDPLNEEAHVKLGLIYWELKMFGLSEKHYLAALKANPVSKQALLNLARLYRDLERPDLAEKYYLKVPPLYPGDDGVLTTIGWFYRENGNIDLAEKYYLKSLKLNPGNPMVYQELSELYAHKGDIKSAKEYYMKAVEMDPGVLSSDVNCGKLAVLHQETKDAEKAGVYYAMANNIRFKEYNPQTKRNYFMLKDILDKNGIKLVCAQYPMRSVEPLKRMLDGRNSIIFVDNEMSFKDAVKRHGYKTYFTDMFGGDFGHCTQEGNRLLARNISNAILKEVFGK